MTIHTDLDKIIQTLESMRQYELILSDFYKQCAETWSDHESLWLTLANAEIKHAENIQKMQEIIKKKSGSFTSGRPFNPVGINTAIAGIKEYTQKVGTKTLSYERALIIARDIENSVLESRYGEIVNTNDLEYKTLMKTILSQTAEHKKIIEEKIKEIKKS